MLKNLKKFCPKIILKLYRKFRYEIIPYPYRLINYSLIQNKYEALLKSVRLDIKRNNKIRVGFYIVFDSSWGSRPIFEKMINDTIFEPKVVVCPDVARGEKHKWETLNNVFDICKAKYGETYVLNTFDSSAQRFIDLSDQFDLIFIANPYDNMTSKYYTSEYLVKNKRKLTVFCDYGYSGKLRYDLELYKSKSYNLFWKQFVDNESTKLSQRATQYIRDRNVVVSGSCKMDKLSTIEPKKDNDFEKTVIIAPHHTVRKTENGLNLSNFLRFSDLILELPQKYTQIKFIFRPHPLLFTTLRCDDLWGNEKVDSYISELLQNKNVVYSTEGEYFDVFANSDAMIDDCGSFLAEYFYTDKPQCYVLQSDEQFEHEYLEFGKKFFDYVYKAYTKEDIYNFIDKVVLDNNDYLGKERKIFADKEVMVNYPHVNEFIIDYLKNQLL